MKKLELLIRVLYLLSILFAAISTIGWLIKPDDLLFKYIILLLLWMLIWRNISKKLKEIQH